MVDNLQRNLGEQPLAAILLQLELTTKDLVANSTEQLTHKMVTRACKGRLLSKKVRAKVLAALNAASGKNYAIEELFTY